MKKLIPKNKRRPFPYFDFFIPVLIKKDKDYSITRYFRFTESAIYHFNDEDQYDVNKLFGFSFGWHHKNSVRFGWRPNGDLTKIEIVGYEYINKLRVPTIPICDVKLNEWYKYQLKYRGGTFGQIEYSVTDGEKQFDTVHPITLKKKINLGYRLYLYFGGNKKAPHDIVIYQDNADIA
jgi:hypothetical protein